MLELALSALLWSWAAAAVVAQIPPFNVMIMRRNPFGLLPNWYFFTGRLLGHDLGLLLREEDGGGFGAWRELPLARPRPPLAWLWHPDRRFGKLLIDVTSQLVSLRLRGLRDAAPRHPAYALVRRWAERHARPGVRFQFALVGRDGVAGEAPEFFLVSEVHQA